MNRKETKLLVESWRGYINKSDINESLDDALSSVSAIPRAVGEKVADKFKKSDSQTEEADSKFVESVMTHAGSFKKWRPEINGIMGTSPAIKNDETYKKLWNFFWSTFTSKESVRTDDCTDMFYSHLKDVYKRNKKEFNKAFKLLLDHRVASGGTPVAAKRFAAVLVGALFDDYMSEMYKSCWKTSREAKDLKDEFVIELIELVERGFNKKTGECYYLKS